MSENARGEQWVRARRAHSSDEDFAVARRNLKQLYRSVQMSTKLSRRVLVFAAVALPSCVLLSACSQDGQEELPPPPSNVTFPLTVRAEIDGRSELRIQGQSVWWHHFDFEAPGMWGDDQPTFVNGEEWWPIWPLDELAFCNCSSTKEALLQDGLRSDGSTISISGKVGRGDVRIVEQPTAGNNYTASIEFSDPLPDRAWTTITISQN